MRAFIWLCLYMASPWYMHAEIPPISSSLRALIPLCDSTLIFHLWISSLRPHLQTPCVKIRASVYALGWGREVSIGRDTNIQSIVVSFLDLTERTPSQMALVQNFTEWSCPPGHHTKTSLTSLSFSILKFQKDMLRPCGRLLTACLSWFRLFEQSAMVWVVYKSQELILHDSEISKSKIRELAWWGSSAVCWCRFYPHRMKSRAQEQCSLLTLTGPWSHGENSIPMTSSTLHHLLEATPPNTII